MKKFFIILVASLFVVACSDINKEVEGADLTKEFCIELVRNHWDCSMGAYYDNSCGTSYQGYGCGDTGSIINRITNFFDNYTLDRGKSYYKNHVLYIETIPNSGDRCSYRLTVNF
jgi:hypothetical protein